MQVLMQTLSVTCFKDCFKTGKVEWAHQLDASLDADVVRDLFQQPSRLTTLPLIMTDP